MSCSIMPRCLQELWSVHYSRYESQLLDYAVISWSVLSVAWIMIAQWANECISLSVLPVARVTIAQWENECNSLSALSAAWVMIAQL